MATAVGCVIELGVGAVKGDGDGEGGEEGGDGGGWASWRNGKAVGVLPSTTAPSVGSSSNVVGISAPWKAMSIRVGTVYFTKSLLCCTRLRSTSQRCAMEGWCLFRVWCCHTVTLSSQLEEVGYTRSHAAWNHGGMAACWLYCVISA